MKVLQAMMSEEVEEKVGPKGKHNADRSAYRHGTEGTSVVLGGQKARIDKPRLRSKDDKEIPLDILNQFQSEDALNHHVLKLILMGATTRGYGSLQDKVMGVETYGISKSAVSRRFIQETTKGMQEFMSRQLDDDTYPVMMLDGVCFGEYLVLVALGVMTTGEKKILGIREGSSENSEVCKGLISGLIDRGLCAEVPRLFILDGSKALSKAVRESFGETSAIQRCQLHKKRNVEKYLPDTEKSRVIAEMNAAYAEFDYAPAKARLEKLVKSLEYKYPSAAESLREGMEETLTLHKLKVPGLLRIPLSTTNPIESAIGTAREITGRVRHWKNGFQVLRWLSCGFMSAEKQFRKIKGFKLLPILINTLAGRGIEQNEMVS